MKPRGAGSQRSSPDKRRNSGPFVAASFHAQKASQLPGAMRPSPAPSEHGQGGQKKLGEALCPSREQSRAAPRTPRTTFAAAPAWLWASHFFIFTSLLPLPPCASGRCPAPGWPRLAGTAFTLGGSVRRPPAWGLHKMEMLSSILVRFSESRHKPGMPEVSMNS